MIKAVSQDKRTVYICNPDENGKFLLMGMPDGKYNIDLDEPGNPPFYSDPIEINVVKHKAEKINIVLHLIK